MRVAICIATYNRLEGLRRALSGLALQQPVPAGNDPVEAEIVVIDNNPGGEAGAVVEELRPRLPWPLRYVHQPQRGLSHARNAALDNADSADFVAFLDDDEVPAADWFRCLIQAQRRSDADVVAGPVLPIFETVPPQWMTAGGFYEQARYPDGAVIKVAYTGNVLFRRPLVLALGLRFRDELNLTGGEDVDFFSRLRLGGARLRFAAAAVMYESIPRHRLTLGWLLRRWFRTGNCEAILYFDSHQGLAGRLVMAGRGVLRIGLGLAAFTALVPLAALNRRHWLAARLYTVARGCGMLASAFNLYYQEYAKG